MQAEWLAPRASAEFQIGAERFSGRGYVEHLQLTVPPWRLPIRELRWGRFLSDSDSLVWIDWLGDHTKRIVYRNGARVEAREIGEERIVLDHPPDVLRFESAAPLREGRLGATALAAIPGVHSLFPAGILNVRERKWLSRASLTRQGGTASAGMAVHEVVEWP